MQLVSEQTYRFKKDDNMSEESENVSTNRWDASENAVSDNEGNSLHNQEDNIIRGEVAPEQRSWVHSLNNKIATDCDSQDDQIDENLSEERSVDKRKDGHFSDSCDEELSGHDYVSEITSTVYEERYSPDHEEGRNADSDKGVTGQVVNDESGNSICSNHVDGDSANVEASAAQIKSDENGTDGEKSNCNNRADSSLHEAIAGDAQGELVQKIVFDTAVGNVLLKQNKLNTNQGMRPDDVSKMCVGMLPRGMAACDVSPHNILKDGADQEGVLLEQISMGKCMDIQSSDHTDVNVDYGKDINSQRACPVCGKRFATFPNLNRHLKIHTGVKPYQCTMCEKSFLQRSHLKSHMTRHTGVKPFSCAVCEKTFISNSELNIHMRNHTGDRPFPCNTCSKAFKRKSDLNKHAKIHTSGKPYECHLCQKKFASIAGFNYHVKNHSKKKNRKSKQKDASSTGDEDTLARMLKCTVCEKPFLSKYSFAIHMKQAHTGELLHPCSVCDKNCGSRAHLEVHMRIHTGHRPFPCPKCDKRFSRKDNLTKHFRTHTGEKPYQCTLCDKAFRESTSLKDHMRTHSGEKLFQCEVCGDKFSKRRYLVQHSRTHTGDRPFACPICEKKFAVKNNLTVHLRRHSGVKPYACQDCGKGFSDSSSLKTHRRIHTGEKPFACPFCSKRFNQNGGLIHHIRTHTGEKPYKCQYCSKSFKQSGQLQKHTETHTLAKI